MNNLPSTTKFSDFCVLLRCLKKSSSPFERKKEFEKFFRQLNKDVSFQSEELLPFLRILLSTLDSERKFDIKYKKLSQRIGKILSVKSSNLIPADTISSHRAVEKLANDVSNRVGKKNGSLTVQEVNDRLDKMADKEGRDPDDTDFEFLFQNCSEEELIWIFNVIIRNVESYIGVSSSNLLMMLDDDAKKRWTLCRSLSAVVEDISPTDSILGRNFRPMLLARLPRLSDWWIPIAANCGKDFYVELKYDGEHVLLHRIGKDNYKYYTRNGKDFSMDYGSSSRDGSISSRIHSFFADSCVDCVLDVELVLWDKQKKSICRHNTRASDGTSYSLRYVKEESGVSIAVVLFDILHYNGRSLLNVPLEERIKVLEKGVLKKQAEDTIYIAKRHIMSTRDQVEEFFSQSMKNDEEGIVAKSMTSLYLPGSRAKSNGWFKLKPNLASSCSLDLAVVAILLGGGTNGKDAYLIAARDESTSQFVIVGSVSVGLTDLDRRRIYEEATRGGPLSSLPHSSIRGRQIEGKGGYIHPHHCNVVEVTCTGVRGRKLVDPVIKCIREKPLDECDSIEQFEELAEVLRSCKLPDEEETSKLEDETKKRKEIIKEGVVPKKAKKEEEGENSCLHGKTICVLQGIDSSLREKAFTILAKYGVNTVANPVEGTDLIVAVNRNHPRTKTWINKKFQSIIDVKWLIRCEEEEKIVPWNETEVILEVPGSMVIDEANE